jgi:hypothetical protein
MGIYPHSLKVRHAPTSVRVLVLNDPPDGKGVAQDQVTADQYFLKATELGSAPSMTELGISMMVRPEQMPESAFGI